MIPQDENIVLNLARLRRLTVASGVELRPGLNDAEILSLEHLLGQPLPGLLKFLLRETRGVRKHDDELSFDEISENLSTIFPSALQLTKSDSGDPWIVDLCGSNMGCVFFLCHDPPVVLLSALTLFDFVDQYAKEDFETLVRQTKGAVHRIWKDTAASLRETSPFLWPELPNHERFTFADLRHSDVGDGFSWAPEGRVVELRRHKCDLVFAVAKRTRKSAFENLKKFFKPAH
jgi:hypothetical protein